MSSIAIPLKDLITLFYIIMVALATPINNGLIMKFNAVSAKEAIQTKSYGPLCTKNPHKLNFVANRIRSREIQHHAADTGTSCTNQITKILFPSRPYIFNDTKSRVYTHCIKIPIIDHHEKDYKIVVAIAPEKYKLGRGADAMPVVIYIVFPTDDSEGQSFEMPSIYFVSTADGLNLHKKTVEPLLIIDTNRTVTGLKSAEILKFVKFKNKLRNHFNYEV